MDTGRLAITDLDGSEKLCIWCLGKDANKHNQKPPTFSMKQQDKVTGVN